MKARISRKLGSSAQLAPYIEGVRQNPGTWNAARDSAHFAGGGTLLVVSDGIGTMLIVR